MQIFSRMRLGARLITGFLLVVTIGAAVAGVGIFGLNRLNDASERLYRLELLGVSYVKAANVHLIAAGRARLSFAAATDAAEREAAKKTFHDEVAQTRALLEKSRPSFYLERGKVALAQMQQKLDAFVDAGESFMKEMSGKDFAARDEGLVRLDRQVRELNKLADDQLEVLASFKDERGRLAADEGTQLYHSISLLMVVLTGASVLIGVLIGATLTRGLTRQLGGEPGDVAAAATAIAEGDLSGDIDTSRAQPGSVVQAMAQMQHALRRLVGQVRSSSDSIATASDEIAKGNADLSQRTEEQASNLQQTAASMEQLTSTVANNADTARQASQLAGSASVVAGKGGQIVGQVVKTMEEISASSRKIADIIGVIDGIAFQTNILALNAAVEAARAGEQGRGFAVVAGEVRALAQRSAQAAKEIKALIGDSVERVESGGRLVDEAGQTMDEIVTQVRRVTDLISEISAATQEQSSGIGQVGTAVSQLDEVTQRNAALVEESAAAADSLHQQAEELVQAISVFRLAA
jgi:methyl-accepting chemotaxis protein